MGYQEGTVSYTYGEQELIVRRERACAGVRRALEGAVIRGDAEPAELTLPADGHRALLRSEPLPNERSRKRRVAGDVVDQVVAAVCNPELVREERVVGEVLADVGEVEDGLDTERLQGFGGPDPGKHEQLGRVDGPGGEDDFLGGVQREFGCCLWKDASALRSLPIYGRTYRC